MVQQGNQYRVVKGPKAQFTGFAVGYESTTGNVTSKSQGTSQKDLKNVLDRTK